MKKIFRILLALSSVVCLVSCGGLTNPQIPQSVSIATDAQFKANMGTASYDLSDKFGSDALLKKMQDALGSQVGIYDYNEGNNVLTYMIRYPIYEVPIDIQSYLQNLNLDEILKSSDMGLNFTQEVSIPEVTQTGSQTVQIDVASKIRESVSENFSTSYTIAVPEGLIPGKEQNTSISSILSAAGAEKITVDSPAQTIEYETGSAICIDIYRVDANALSDDYKFSLSAAIYAKDDTSKTNALSFANVDARDGGKLLLPLDVTGGIPGDFFIFVDGTVEGSHPTDASYAHAYSMNVSLTPETTPTVITGIEKSSADLGIESYTIQDMSVSLAELEGLFKNAEVGEGYLALSAELPAGWQNLKATAEININGAGLENLTIADVTPSSKLIDKKLDLRAKKIDLSLGNEITVTGSVGFEIFGATIDLRSGDLKIGYEASITKLNSVVIDLNSGKYSVIKEKLNYSLPTDGSTGSVKLPSEMLNYVKSIGFGELVDGRHYKHKEDGKLSTEETDVSEGFGIKARFVNTLPLQSNINLTLSSTVFNLTGANAIKISIPGNTGDTYKEETWAAWPSVDFSALDKTVDHYVDMSLTAAFENDELKLQDVVMGTSYKIGFELESMLYDFDSVVLNTSDIAYSGEQSLEGFDLNNMLGGMGIAEEDIKKLGIPSLPVYFYAQTPADDGSALGNLLGKIGISGDVSISYDTTTTSAEGVETKTVNLLADADGKPIHTVKAVKWPASGSTIDASKCTFTEDGNYSFSFTDANNGGLAQIISSFPSNLKFTYSIGLTNTGGASEITVYSSMIPKVGVTEGSVTTTESATSLKIDMAAILPLSIKIGSDISLDIMELTDSEWNKTNAQKDLLNREDASTYQEYVDYIDSLESFTMSYRMNVEEFISGIELGLSITDEASGLSKNVPVIGSGQKEMVIKGEEIKRILTTYPFHPSVKLELPANTITIKRSAFIKSDDAAETPKIGVNVGLKIKMDGDTPITVWGGKK